MYRTYKCALRHSDNHCPVYFEKFPEGECNSKCPAFIASQHKCKHKTNTRYPLSVRVERGLGNYVQGYLLTDDDGEKLYNEIDYCPYCGELITYGVTALKVAMQRFKNMDKDKEAQSN